MRMASSLGYESTRELMSVDDKLKEYAEVIKNSLLIEDGYISKDCFDAVDGMTAELVTIKESGEHLNAATGVLLDYEVVKNLSTILDKIFKYRKRSYESKKSVVSDGKHKLMVHALIALSKMVELSEKIAEAAVRERCLLDVLKQILVIFKETVTTGGKGNETFDFVLNAIVTCYNFVRHDNSQIICELRKEDFIKAIEPYNEIEGPPKMFTFVILLYVRVEDEMCTNPETVRQYIGQMIHAVKSKQKMHGLTKTELLRVLVKLSELEAEKKQLCDLGIIPKIKSILDLQTNDNEDIKHCIIILTNVAFYNPAAVRSEIYQFTKKKFLKHTDKQVSEAGRALIWCLDNASGAGQTLSKKRSDSRPARRHRGDADADPDPDPDSDPGRSGSSRGHIMISYQWNSKEKVLKIRDFLKENGFEVWIDVEKMGDDLLDSMADAVERAWVVLICYSRNYKSSPNCRMEASYTVQRKVQFLPLRMEVFEPDGWLGLIINTRYYYDFTPTDILQVRNRLLSKLRGMQDGDQHDLLPRMNATAGESDTNFLLEWTVTDFRNWCRENKIESEIMRLGINSGSELRALLQMHQESPNAFYDYLLKVISLGDLSALLTAMEKLTGRRMTSAGTG